MNDRGFSYIETIFSLILIFIFFIPIFLFLRYFIISLNYSNDSYEMSLLNNSLIEHVENILYFEKDPLEYLENLNNNKLYTLLKLTESEFNDIYPEKFNYTIKINNYIFTTNKNLKNNFIYFDKRNENDIYNKDATDIIKFKNDGSFVIIKTEGNINIKNNDIFISTDKTKDNNIVILDICDLDNNQININIKNNSSLQVLIYKNNKLSNENINIDYFQLQNEKNVLIDIINCKNNIELELNASIENEKKLLKNIKKRVIL